jgi:hypothetical protein
MEEGVNSIMWEDTMDSDFVKNLTVLVNCKDQTDCRHVEV